MSGRNDTDKQLNINGLALKEAGAADAPVLLRLLLDAFREYAAVLDPPSAAHEETVDTVRRRLARGGAALATLDAEPAACVFYNVHDDGFLYLSRLSVAPRFRRRGIAGALVKHVEARARQSRARGVRLGVRLQLSHLLEWYERLGYGITKYMTHEGYPTPTYVYLEKTLSLASD